MGFWASGDDSVPAGVAPEDPYKRPGGEERRWFNESEYAGSIPKSVLGTRQNSEAVGSFYDDRDSKAFTSRLRGDMAAIGSRTAPQAAGTKMNPGAYLPGSAKVGPMSTYAGAKADFSDSSAVGAQQAAMMDRFAGIAAGTTRGPGVEQLYANSLAQKAAQTSAAGSGTARFGGAATMRALVAGKDAASQQTAAAAQVVGAQEQQAAQSMLASLASSARGAEWDAASGQASLAQQAALWSAGQKNQAAMAQAGFDQQTGMFNASATQKQYDLDMQTAIQNMEAKLRAQGLDDAAIAARLGFMQDQINRDKSDRMAFWDYAYGDRKFDAQQQFQADTLAAQQGYARWAAGGQALGAMAGAYSAGKSSSGPSWDGSGMSGGASRYSYGDASTAARLGGG